MRTVMYKGQRLTLREAARVTHQPYARLLWRLDNGWTEERALETPWSVSSLPILEKGEQFLRVIRILTLLYLLYAPVTTPLA